MGGENKQSISSKDFSVEKIQSRVLFGLELFQVRCKGLVLTKGTDKRRETCSMGVGVSWRASAFLFNFSAGSWFPLVKDRNVKQ